MTEIAAHYTVGRLLCGRVRHELLAMKFCGYRIEFLESPGWIERQFTVRGDPSAVKQFNDWFSRLVKILEEADGTN